MILGYYYHIPFMEINGVIYTPGYQGAYIDVLASKVDKLFLFLHRETTDELNEMDYEIKQKNIVLIDLGAKPTFLYRFIYGKKLLKAFKREASSCDILLIRAPSPLAPSFYHCFNKLTKITYLLVGDYVQSAKGLKLPFHKKLMAGLLMKRYQKAQEKVIKKSTVFTNSRMLYRETKKLTPNVYEVRTTTLSKADFFTRKDTCNGSEINLLYTGRLDLDKGLIEMIHCLKALKDASHPICLHFVGWEASGKNTVLLKLKKETEELQLTDSVCFHGRKSLGTELNKMYRMADIYIIGSKNNEGFPRTIWEAMANSLPVIATSVGSIPDFLRDGEDALIIEPSNASAMAEAVTKLLSDRTLRQKLIQNGRILANENTLAIQTEKHISLLLHVIDNFNLRDA